MHCGGFVDKFEERHYETNKRTAEKVQEKNK